MIDKVDFGWDLPPGVTPEMCDNSGGMALDENALCANCEHKLIDHKDDTIDVNESCYECDCKGFKQ